MDEWIGELTHDNESFEEQWPSIYDKIRTVSIPKNPSLVLFSLEKYVRIESKNDAITYVKYLFVKNVLNRLVSEQVSIPIDHLVELFVRSIDVVTMMTEWDSHWLEHLYLDFELGEKLKVSPIRKDLIEQILQILSKNKMTFHDEHVQDQWQRLLTSKIFSDSNNNENTLNQTTIVQTMPNQFEVFYKELIRQSPQSSISLKLVQVLQESDPKVFQNSTMVTKEVSPNSTSDQTFSSEHISQLIRSYSNNPEAIKTNTTDLLNILEQLIIHEQFDDGYKILSKLIVPHLNSFDLLALIKMLTRLGPTTKQKDALLGRILRPIIYGLDNLTIDKELALPLFDLAKMILKLHCLDAPGWSLRLLKKKDFYPWPTLQDQLIELLSLCVSYESINNTDHFSPLDDLEEIIQLIHRRAQKSPLTLRSIHPFALETILRWVSADQQLNAHVYRMGGAMIEFIDLERVNEDLCLKWIDCLYKGIIHQEESENKTNNNWFSALSRCLVVWIDHIKVFSHAFHQRVVELLTLILEHPFYDDDLNMTLSHIILVTILVKVVMTLVHENDVRLYIPFLDEFHRIGKAQQPPVQEWWTTVWLIIGPKFTSVAIEHLDDIFDCLIDEKNLAMINIISSVAIDYPDRIPPYWDRLVDFLLSNQCQYFSAAHGVCARMIQTNPRLVKMKHIDEFFNALDLLPFNHELCLFIHSLASVASVHPEFFDPHRTKLIRIVIEKQNLMVFECLQKYLIASMIIHAETKLDDIFHVLIDLLKQKNCSADVRQQIFFSCLQIGIKHRDSLVQHQIDLGTIDSTFLLNFINGTITSETDQTWMRRARFDLEQIEQKIALTKEKDANKDKEVTKDLPSWMLEVTKLLNRRMDNDWRLLGEQLGYTSAELTYCSLESNPSMMLLKDWLTTHELDEGIQSLVYCLDRINRHDVEQVIRQATTGEGHPIPEKISVDIRRYSSILISFHETNEKLISQLAEHLKSTGYSCQTFDQRRQISELERSIRGAKVVLCDNTVEYLSSSNSASFLKCVENLRKPLINLREKTTNTQVVSDQRVVSSLPSVIYLHNPMTNEWSEESFIELLTQIRYYAAPNPDLIGENYRHWFVPRFNSLIFLKAFFNKNPTLVTSWKTLPLTNNHPQLVLSYHWNQQHDALILYQQLTQLGYRIFMDLFQMNGGKPLIDKVQDAVSQSSCLIACITPEYIQSSRGLYEIQLARHHQKSIVLLLVERTDLEGVTSPKDYVIDFLSQNNRQNQEEKSFEKLLVHLRELIPDVRMNRPRYLLDMQRPQSARLDECLEIQRPKRITSASINPHSRVCSLM